MGAEVSPGVKVRARGELRVTARIEFGLVQAGGGSVLMARTAWFGPEGSMVKLDASLAFVNPGSPVVSSQGEGGAVVWVVDENASRLASLLSDTTARPILYAIDGTSLAPLWSSAKGSAALHLGGKYETPIVAHGTVFVVTDRVQAFVLGP